MFNRYNNTSLSQLINAFSMQTKSLRTHADITGASTGFLMLRASSSFLSIMVYIHVSCCGHLALTFVFEITHIFPLNKHLLFL